MAARSWQDCNFSGRPDPRIRKAGVIQGPLQQRNQRPLLVLAVGEVVTVGRVVKLVEMSTAGISDGQVTGLSGLIK